MRVTAATITVAQIFRLRDEFSRIDNMFVVADIACGLRQPSPLAKTRALRSVAEAKVSLARAWNRRHGSES